MSDQTAADVFVGRLIDWGVEVIFGLPGDGINGFMDALRKRGEAWPELSEEDAKRLDDAYRSGEY